MVTALKKFRSEMDSGEKSLVGIQKGVFRCEPLPQDIDAVRALLRKTGFFRPDEIDVALELIRERLAKGPVCGYAFVFLTFDGSLAGYCCYGPIPCTISSYDIYWIAVDPDCQGYGLGKTILREAQQRIQEETGTRIYIETSHSEKYLPTRRFYESNGFERKALLEDFFAPGDGKAIYCKILTATPTVKAAKP